MAQNREIRIPFGLEPPPLMQIDKLDVIFQWYIESLVHFFNYRIRRRVQIARVNHNLPFGLSVMIEWVPSLSHQYLMAVGHHLEWENGQQVTWFARHRWRTREPAHLLLRRCSTDGKMQHTEAGLQLLNVFLLFENTGIISNTSIIKSLPHQAIYLAKTITEYCLKKSAIIVASCTDIGTSQAHIIILYTYKQS